MPIIYDDVNPAPFNGRRVDYYDLDATKHWLTHYANQLFLEAILRAPKSWAERKQAAAELEICARKQVYWARHPNWSAFRAGQGALQLKTQWGAK